jgi:hypothetical protein
MSPPNTPGDEPKLIIDSDWKAQAQAEKDRLAAAQKVKQKSSDAPSPAGTAPGEPGEGEPLGFSDLVTMLATQAITYMGGIPDPRTGKAILAPEYARLYIDMLGILQDKTKGNLTETEQKMMDGTVSELRSEFVALMGALDKAIAEGKITPQMMGGGSAGPGSGVVVPQAGAGVGGSLGGPTVFGR